MIDATNIEAATLHDCCIALETVDIVVITTTATTLRRGAARQVSRNHDPIRTHPIGSPVLRTGAFGTPAEIVAAYAAAN